MNANKKASHILTSNFFKGSAVDVSMDLLGKVIVFDKKGMPKKEAVIIETEAYEGREDRASHASRGITSRTEVMFGPPGNWYVYLVYGMHWMLNTVCGDKGHPAAVLIRGIALLTDNEEIKILSGPGRLTATLGIDGSFNKTKIGRTSGLWIEDRGIIVPKTRIKKGPRVGVDYAGEKWAKKHYRFMIKNPDVVIKL